MIFLRKRFKLSQHALANKIEVSTSLIKMVENNKSNLSIQNIIKVVKIFEVSADDFLLKDMESELSNQL